MLNVAHPWLGLLVLLPLIARMLPAHRETRTSVRTPFFDQLVRQLGAQPTPGAVELGRTVVQRVIVAVVWLLVVAALVRPQWVGEPIERVESARDLMLVVDLSGSMDTNDFIDEDGRRLSRLDAVKQVLGRFVADRETDRLGLIVFGNAAFVQCPFTLDHRVFDELLDEVEVGMAGPQTMLGDALGLAVKAFAVSEAEQKTTVLLTDGNDTGSKVPPTKAADLAARAGLTVHVIGVGDPAAAGEAPLDEKTLRRIASATGGEFFTAGDRTALAEVSERIDRLEPLEYDATSYRPTFELYHWPLGAALLLAVGFHLAMAVRAAVHAATRRARA